MKKWSASSVRKKLWPWGEITDVLDKSSECGIAHGFTLLKK